MFPFPRIPNRYDDEQRLQRLEDQDEESPRHSRVLLAIGLLLLVATLALARVGWGGAGLVLVPIRLGLLVAGGLQLAINRMGG